MRSTALVELWSVALDPVASTVLIPTVLSRVLLPDMFEPLTTSARGPGPSRTSFTTQRDCGSSGWPNNTYGYGRLDVMAAVMSGVLRTYLPVVMSGLVER